MRDCGRRRHSIVAIFGPGVSVHLDHRRIVGVLRDGVNNAFPRPGVGEIGATAWWGLRVRHRRQVNFQRGMEDMVQANTTIARR